MSGYHSHQWFIIIFPLPPLISHVISFNNYIDYFGQPFLIPSSLSASQNTNTKASSASWICPSWKVAWISLPWQDLNKSEKALPQGHISISKRENARSHSFQEANAVLLSSYQTLSKYFPAISMLVFISKLLFGNALWHIPRITQDLGIVSGYCMYSGWKLCQQSCWQWSNFSLCLQRFWAQCSVFHWNIICWHRT